MASFPPVFTLTSPMKNIENESQIELQVSNKFGEAMITTPQKDLETFSNEIRRASVIGEMIKDAYGQSEKDVMKKYSLQLKPHVVI